MTDKIRLCLGIPHAPHKPGRTESMTRLVTQLHEAGAVRDIGEKWGAFHTFDRPEPHPDWSLRMWTWGRDMTAGEPGAQFVTIQDDVIVPDNFYDILQALYAAVPDQIISLIGIHPVGREIARGGGRWYRTRAWLMGNGYSIPGSMMAEFVAWRERNEAAARVRSEDSIVNLFAVETGRDIWHCVPSLIEHDVTIESTWGAANHAHRRATVSFRDYSRAELARPDFWIQAGATRLLTDHLGPRCWCCLDPAYPDQGEPAALTFEPSGVSIGARCWSKFGEMMAAQWAAKQMGQ